MLVFEYEGVELLNRCHIAIFYANFVPDSSRNGRKGEAINPLELLRKGRSDLSNFLIHLTKNGSFELWRDYRPKQGHFLFGESETLNAARSLVEILGGNPPTLLARAPFGIFKLTGINTGKNVKMNIPVAWLRSVCFSETPLRELKSFYRATQEEKNWTAKKNKYQKYGLAFHADFVRNRGGHPVFYYDRRNAAIAQSVEALGKPELHPVTQPILPLCEPYGPKVLEPQKEIDFRWEREWRIVGDFQFAWTDVAFGICAEKHIEAFEARVQHQFPFLDPDWEIDRLKSYLDQKGLQDLASRI